MFSFNKRGFTLIEVLLSLLILSTAAVAIIRVFSVSTFVLSRASDAVWASHLLNEKVAEYEIKMASQGGLEPETASGDFDDEFSDYKWKVTVADASKSSVLLEADIFTKEEEKKPLLSSSFYLKKKVLMQI